MCWPDSEVFGGAGRLRGVRTLVTQRNRAVPCIREEQGVQGPNRLVILVSTIRVPYTILIEH
jgi:hypothetical protein